MVELAGREYILGVIRTRVYILLPERRANGRGRPQDARTDRVLLSHEFDVQIPPSATATDGDGNISVDSHNGRPVFRRNSLFSLPLPEAESRIESLSHESLVMIMKYQFSVKSGAVAAVPLIVMAAFGRKTLMGD